VACEFCEADGGVVLLRDELCRIVLPGDADHPALCRVIVNRHVREMTDLEPAQREHLMRVVFMVERALRDTLSPHKVNLASLGNVTPHVHWHVVPRFTDDPHFPNAFWTAPKRAPRALPVGDLAAVLRGALTFPGRE
jgi:diadenosine tetraphosphate (Ap4A) HIT family hydrolase